MWSGLVWVHRFQLQHLMNELVEVRLQQLEARSQQLQELEDLVEASINTTSHRYDLSYLQYVILYAISQWIFAKLLSGAISAVR